MADDKKIEPLRPANFGLSSHRFQLFDCNVPGNTSKETLVTPGFWAHVAPKMNPHDEIRVCADDDSFVALLHVTYSVGHQVRVKMVYHVSLEEVDYDAMHAGTGDYEIKQRGVKKWCIIQKETGDVIKELIPTQKQALQELDDIEKAMAA